MVGGLSQPLLPVGGVLAKCGDRFADRLIEAGSISGDGKTWNEYRPALGLRDDLRPNRAQRSVPSAQDVMVVARPLPEIGLGTVSRRG